MKRDLPVEEIVNAYKNGIKVKDLAIKYGVSESLIYSRIKNYSNNIEKKNKNQLPMEEIIEKLGKVTKKQLSKEYGVSEHILEKEITQYYKDKGEEKPNLKTGRKKSKKNIAQIEEIIFDYENGLRSEEIAKKYGLSKYRLYRAIRQFYKQTGKRRIKKPNERDEAIISDYESGIEGKEIAAKYGISHSRIIYENKKLL